MAKAKLQELRAPGPLDHAQLMEVWERAKSVPKFANPFPQNWAYKGTIKQGLVRSLAGIPDVGAARLLRVDADLTTAKVDAKVLAQVYGDLGKVMAGQAVAAVRNSFYLACAFDRKGIPNYPDQSREVGISLSTEDGEPHFHFSCSTSFSWTTDAHEENRRLFAAERAIREDLSARAIAGARLPLRIVPAGKSFDVEHTAGGSTGHKDKPDEEGLGWFGCTLPGDTPADLARRALDALAAMTLEGLPRYSAHLYVEARPKQPDPCGEVYGRMQALRWPVASTALSTAFRIGSPAALDDLRPFLRGPSAALKLNLARFRPAGQAARSPVTKLVVKTRQDGHHLSLLLPPEHLAFQAQLEWELQLSFGP